MKYRYTAEEKVTVWLDSFESLTYQQKIKIISAVQPITKMVTDFEECTDTLLKIIPQETLNLLKDTLADGDYLCSLLSKLEKEDIFFITLLSPEYPQSLANISAPPVILYCKGNRNLLKSRRFAIVGSRRTLTWAQAFTRELSANLSKHFTIVTGLAEGGDLAAIEGVLQSCKNTENDNLDAPMPVISVLAYGFDHVYPAEHADILQTIAKRGLVLTE
ncbi:MAG: DNA-processing protein DprA, partial [Clostridia bacterium]|nr:DNA-processing protein DprA [Clostridia bacterium]